MFANPVLLLEINEIPWRVIDALRGMRHVDAFFARATTWTTTCDPSWRLSPWITWPTFHRGLPPAAHGSRALGQDPSTFAGSPIWRDVRARGLDVGVCGSLQSWPPEDPGPRGFFVPDTFAHDARCIPRWVEPIQAFNLAQVAANARVIRPRVALTLAPELARVLRPRTVARILAQLASERVDRTRLARRPIFQTILFWDVFRRLYDPKRPPALATFFTNHVASVMHRYWSHLFPEDFAPPPAARPHERTMRFAWRVLDEILGDALAWQRQNPRLSIVLATSMGQAAVDRAGHSGLEGAMDGAKLLEALGLGAGDATPRLAMVPQIGLEATSEASLTRIVDRLCTCRAESGDPLFYVERRGLTLSVTLRPLARADLDAGWFLAGDRKIGWAAAGITLHAVAPGTANHVPDGVLAIVGPAARAFPAGPSRAPIALETIKDPLLAFVTGSREG